MPYENEFSNAPLGLQAGDTPLYKSYSILSYALWTNTLVAGLYCAIVDGKPVAINAQAITTPVLGVVKREQASYIASAPIGYTYGAVNMNHVSIFNDGYALVKISENAPDVVGIGYGVKVWAEASLSGQKGRAKVLNTDLLALDPNSIFIQEMATGVWLVRKGA